MARFDVFQYPVGSRQLVVDIQADFLDGLNTRIVVPLLPAGSVQTVLNRLNPKITIGGQSYLFAVQYVASVSTKSLKKPVTNLIDEADSIIASMDLIFQGF